ncbi:N-acetylmuramoyl-L-alanine amidase [Metabacillus halosaccharovorans]|uniref:peptidoglycan recognition protein family protein n=1 Tax=Metabacillus halosaccharovorans TaxID=930124 RepID=UPI0034CE99F1
MAIKDLPKYKDIRNSIRRKGRYPYVGTSVKNTHVIHQSMTARNLKGSNPYSFANTHIDTNGWHGCAYIFVIMPDGTIYQTDDLDRRTYHAGNSNTCSIGTCLVGDFRKDGANEKPTKEQMVSLYLLNKELIKELPHMKYVKGHNECPGYSWKNCPGDTWDYKNVIAGKGLKLGEDHTKDIEGGNVMLKKGDKGELVKVLNFQLASLGHTGWHNREKDEFTSTTENALKQFQSGQKMEPTGVYDYQTAIQFAKVLNVYHKHWMETRGF